MSKRSFGNLLAHDAPLHRLVKDEGGAGEQRRKEIALLLSQKRPVRVNAPGGSHHERVLLVDVPAVWAGLENQQQTFSNVAYPAEDGVVFRKATPDSQRLRQLPHGRVLRVETDKTKKEAVLQVSIPHNPDWLDSKGETALFAAAGRRSGGQDEIIALIKGYADPDARSQAEVYRRGKIVQVEGGCPLIAAIDAGNIENVTTLLALGASTDIRIQAAGSDGQMRQRTPLMYASDKQQEDAATLGVQDLVDALSGVNTYKEITEMLSNPTDTVVNLLEKTHFRWLASVENLWGFYPLHVICSAAGATPIKHLRTVIKAFPAAVGLTTINGDLPLHLALREGSMEAEAIEELMVLPEGWKEGFVEDKKTDVVLNDDDAVRRTANPLNADDEDEDTPRSPGSPIAEDDDPDNEDPSTPYNQQLLRPVRGGELAQVQDSYGCLPLHLALRSSGDDVTMAVMDKYPEAGAEVDGDGDSCLRLALCRVTAVNADSDEAAQRAEDEDEEEDTELVQEEEDDLEIGEHGISGDVDNDGILDAEEREALSDETARFGATGFDIQELNPFAKVQGMVGGLTDLLSAGKQVDMMQDPEVGLRVEPCSAEVIKALLAADPEAATRKDIDGRTALQLCIDLSVPPEQTMKVLLANKEAAAEPLVKARLTLSITVPRGMNEDRNIIGKLPNNHCVHLRVDDDIPVGRIIRKSSLLDATVVWVEFSDKTKKKGDEHIHVLNSGQKIRLKVPRALASDETSYSHPFQFGNLELLHYYVPPGAEPGAEDWVYTTAGCRVPVETPKRKQVGRPVPLLIRPLKPPFPDNPEHLLHAAIQRGKQPDVVICLVEAYPEAAKVPNQYNMLPLHLAMIDGATGPMIDVRPSELYTNLSPLLTLACSGRL